MAHFILIPKQMLTTVNQKLCKYQSADAVHVEGQIDALCVERVFYLLDLNKIQSSAAPYWWLLGNVFS